MIRYDFQPVFLETFEYIHVVQRLLWTMVLQGVAYPLSYP